MEQKNSPIPPKKRNKVSFGVENVARGPEKFLLTALCSLLRRIVGLLVSKVWQHYVEDRISRMRGIPRMITFFLRILNLLRTAFVQVEFF